jgi:hypothetical protein
VYDDIGVSEEEKKNAREKSWEESTKMLQYCSSILFSFEEHVATVMDGLERSSTGRHPVVSTVADHRLFYLSAFLYPLRNMVCVDSKGKEVTLPAYIVRDSVKFPNRDVAAISTVLKYVDEMRSILQSHARVLQGRHDDATMCRLKSGLLLRNLKDHWVTALLVASVAEIHSMDSSYHDSNEDETVHVSMIADKAFRFFQDIQTHNLDECWKIRPLLDGKAILASLDLPRGPMVGTYLEEQMKWMLLNPKGTRDECEVHLREMRKRDLELDASRESSNDKNRSCSGDIIHQEGGCGNGMTGHDEDSTFRKHGKTKRLHLE